MRKLESGLFLSIFLAILLSFLSLNALVVNAACCITTTGCYDDNADSTDGGANFQAECNSLSLTDDNCKACTGNSYIKFITDTCISDPLCRNVCCKDTGTQPNTCSVVKGYQCGGEGETIISDTGVTEETCPEDCGTLQDCSPTDCSSSVPAQCKCGSQTAALDEYCCVTTINGQSVSFVETDQSECLQQCTPTQQTFKVSGHVYVKDTTTGIPSASVVIPQLSLPSVNTDNSGFFEITGVSQGSSYTLSASAQGYTFHSLVDGAFAVTADVTGKVVYMTATSVCGIYDDADNDGFCDCEWRLISHGTPTTGPNQMPCDCDRLRRNQPEVLDPSAEIDVCDDNRDNDCDGLVDNNDPGCRCIDHDGDGYYSNCDFGRGLDCDDNDRLLNTLTTCQQACGAYGVNPSRGEECDRFTDGTWDSESSLCTVDKCVNCRCPVTLVCPPGWTYDQDLGRCDPPALDCSSETLTLTINPITSQPFMRLLWSGISQQCLEHVENFGIRRCMSQDDSPCTPSGATLWVDGSATSMEDQSFGAVQPGKNYCYDITADFDSTVPLDEPVTATACIVAGNAECLRQHDPHFCIRYDPSSTSVPLPAAEIRAICKADNTLEIEERCPDTKVCVDSYPVEGQTECLAMGLCWQCNWLYGMFGYIDKQVLVGSVYENCDEIPMCFWDYTNTTSDMYDSCSNVDSCYDYNSEDACTADQCAMNNCVWENINENIGYGVCRSSVEDEQHCEYCNSRLCNKEICMKYGNCYYDELPNGFPEPNYCINKRDTICAFYDTSDDCINSNNQASIEGVTQKNQELDLNVFYSPPPELVRKGIDNTPLKLSDDWFSFGKCKWDEEWSPTEGRCYRDADDNEISDHQDNVESPKCDYADTSDPCHHDFTNPLTILSLPQDTFEGIPLFGSPVSIPFSVTDNKYASGFKTYYCFAPVNIRGGATPEITNCISTSGAADNNGYPPSSSSFSGNSFEMNLEYTGLYSLKYYSVDPAKNIEHLKSQSLYVDKSPPALLVSHTTRAPYKRGDKWYTDVTISIRFAEPEDCTCTGLLKKTDGTSPAASPKGDFTDLFFNPQSSATVWPNFYGGLEDGSYRYTLHCQDKYGNWLLSQQEPYVYSFNVEADAEISDPKPNSTYPGGKSLNLSIKTINQGVCKYDDEYSLYSAMRNTFPLPSSLGPSLGYLHKLPFVTSQTGIYKYYTACRFTPPSAPPYTTEGNAADMIIFAVDTLPPATSYSLGNNQPFVPGTWFNSPVAVTFECKDSSLNLLEQSGKSWDFGCKEFYFCDTGLSCTPEKQSASDVVIEGKNLKFQRTFTTSTTARFYGSDGHNTEEIKTISVNIDSVPPVLDIMFMKGNEEVNTLSYGLYKVKVVSTKPIQQIRYFSYSFEGEEVELAPSGFTPGQTSFESQLIIDSSLAWYGKTGNVGFKAGVTDTHSLEADIEESIGLNTVAPNTPKLDPLFEKAGSQNTQLVQFAHQGVLYPLYYYQKSRVGDDFYFTNAESLFVTGSTEDHPLEIRFYDIQQPEDRESPASSFVQQQNPKLSEVPRRVSRIERKDTSELRFNAPSLSNEWSAGKYVRVSGHERKGYGHYREYYRIAQRTNLNDGSVVLRLETPLEADVSISEDIFVYALPYPEDWFGSLVGFEYSQSGDNRHIFYALGRDIEGGMSSTTPEYNLFVDLTKPYVAAVSPQGIIGDERAPLVAIVREPAMDSGIYNNSINLTITHNGRKTVYGFTDLAVSERRLGGFDIFNITYNPVEPWNGTYNIKLSLFDYAFNLLDDTGVGFGNCFVTDDDCCFIAEGDGCDPNCGVKDWNGNRPPQPSDFSPVDPDCPLCTAQPGDCCFPIIDGIIDPDCPPGIDPDATGCEEGACDPNSMMYCHDDVWYSNEYCSSAKCGLTDSSCCDIINASNSGDGCCTPGLCDTVNNAYCRPSLSESGGDFGVWTGYDYNLYCGQFDANCLEGSDLEFYIECLDGTCDAYNASMKTYCRHGLWDKYLFSDMCTGPNAEPLPSATCPNIPCTQDSCDTLFDKLCDDNWWTSMGYFSNCSNVDPGYGCPVCDYYAYPHTNCDKEHKMWCGSSHDWRSDHYCDFYNCGALDPYCTAFCTPLKDDCCNPYGTMCDPDCQEFQDPDCEACTVAGGDCCVALQDDICDPDCPAMLDYPDCDPGWQIVVDRMVPSMPKFSIVGSPFFNPDPLKRWFVNRTMPTIILNFTMRNSTHAERLNITTPEVELSGTEYAGQFVSCRPTMIKNYFECSPTSPLDEGLYFMSVSARKTLPDGKLGTAGSYQFKFGVDQTPPDFDLDLPGYVNESEAVVTADVFNTEYALRAKIASGASSIDNIVSLEDGSGTYVFVVPSGFDWGGVEGARTVFVTLMDYAGNTNMMHGVVVIDRTAPLLRIERILTSPLMIFSEFNITSSNNTVIVIGNVTNDTVRITASHTYPGMAESAVVQTALPCIPGSEQGTFCIDRSPVKISKFRISVTLSGALNHQVMNSLQLTASDAAGNSRTSMLFMLYDTLPPAEPVVRIIERRP